VRSLTSHPSGRLRRRLTPALGFKSFSGSVASQRQSLGRASHDLGFFVWHLGWPACVARGRWGNSSHLARVFVRASIASVARAMCRNVTTSQAVRLSHAGPHHLAFLWCVWCGTIVRQRTGLGFRLTVRSRRTATPPLNSSVSHQMTSIAIIRVLGVLHGMAALLCLWGAFKLFALPENEYISRARVIYSGCTSLLLSSLLLLCAISAWQRPEFAWLFALLSLLTYLPSPRWAPPKINTLRPISSFRKQYLRYIPLVIAGRILAVVVFAGTGYGLHG